MGCIAVSFHFGPFVGSCYLGLGTSEWCIHDLELAFRPQLLDGKALNETHPWWMPTLTTAGSESDPVRLGS